MADYLIREAQTIEEVEQLTGVLQQVFALSERATPPAWFVLDSVKAGGVMLGLWWEGEPEPVGFSYGCVGKDDESPYLYSNGLGVLPAHRSGRHAYALKVAQREHALARGLDRVVWTFTALRSVNAHLFLTRLGGVAREYILDTRGTQGGEWPTEALPIDEFVVEWRLQSTRTLARLAGDTPAVVLDDVPRVTRCSGHGLRFALDAVLDPPKANRVCCEIPADVQTLVNKNPALAHDWRIKTRPLFETLTRDGYSLTECIHRAADQRSYYIFEKALTG